MRSTESIKPLIPEESMPSSISINGLRNIMTSKNNNNDGEASWDYTLIPSQQNRLGIPIRGYEEPYVDHSGEVVLAMYHGRPVISRDSQVNGGVYIVPGSQEAIVVDDGTKPKEGDRPKEINTHYQKAFNDFIDLAKSYGVSVRQGVRRDQITDMLKALLISVGDTIGYDIKFSEYIRSNFKDRKINLHDFIAEGKGVCRHQALLAGYILERLINGGFVSGSVSVDRNYVEDKGGHAWARYTDEKGRIYIIDPTNGYAGKLDRKSNKIWSYSRPEDKV